MYLYYLRYVQKHPSERTPPPNQIFAAEELPGIRLHVILLETRILNLIRFLRMCNCCVSGCKTVEGEIGKSFFRFPKDPFRCEQWKRALGFIANHRYNNLTPQQCFVRLRLCSLHFENNDFVGLLKQRLSKSACPSLYIEIENVNIDKPLLMPIKNEKSDEAQIQLTELQQENDDIDKLLLLPIKVEKTEEGNESFCAQVRFSPPKQENFDIDRLLLTSIKVEKTEADNQQESQVCGTTEPVVATPYYWLHQNSSTSGYGKPVTENRCAVRKINESVSETENLSKLNGFVNGTKTSILEAVQHLDYAYQSSLQTCEFVSRKKTKINFNNGEIKKSSKI